MLPMLAAFDFELRQRVHERGADQGRLLAIEFLDRKSTRLNSSHSQISYAVFCLKKKKTRADSTKGTTHQDGEFKVIIQISLRRVNTASAYAVHLDVTVDARVAGHNSTNTSRSGS